MFGISWELKSTHEKRGKKNRELLLRGNYEDDVRDGIALLSRLNEPYCPVDIIVGCIMGANVI